MKLWLYFILFSLFIFLALWLLQTVFLQSSYNQMAISRIEKCAERIVKNSGSSRIDDIIDDTAYENSLLIYVVGEDNNVLYSADEHINGRYRRRQPPERNNSTVEKPKPKGGYRSLTDSYDEFLERLGTAERAGYITEDGDTYICGARLRYEGKDAVLYISKSLGSVEGTIDIIRRQLILVTVISLILGFILAYFISRRFSEPIREITEQARHMGDASYSAEHKSGFCAETDELSLTLSEKSQSLIRAENSRREFFANISHDLRTPLTMIKGYAEMVRDLSWEDKESREADLDVIIKESDRLTGLVNELLDYSSMQSGAVSYDMQKNDLGALALAVTERFSGTSPVGVETDIDNEAFAVCDSQAISRVLYNLIDNALTHSGNAERIIVSVRKDEGGVTVSVTDFGEGIDAADLPHIWDRYFTRKQQQRNKAGSGLGLAVSREILTAHDALFGAESSEKSGTRFWFRLKTEEG